MVVMDVFIRRLIGFGVEPRMLACSNRAPVTMTLKIVEDENVVTYEIGLQFALPTIDKQRRNVNRANIEEWLRILKLNTQDSGIAVVAFAPGDNRPHRYSLSIKITNCYSLHEYTTPIRAMESPLRCLVIEDEADTSRYIGNGLTFGPKPTLAYDADTKGICCCRNHPASGASWPRPVVRRSSSLAFGE